MDIYRADRYNAQAGPAGAGESMKKKTKSDKKRKVKVSRRSGGIKARPGRT